MKKLLPGEVEQNIRFIAEQLLPKGLTPFHDRIIEAADLIAALRVQNPLAESESNVLKWMNRAMNAEQRAEKAEAERDAAHESFSQQVRINVELVAENERLLAHLRTIATCVNLNDAITEAKVAIDAASDACEISIVSSRMCEKGTKSCIVKHDAERKPKSDADILPVYFESREP